MIILCLKIGIGIALGFLVINIGFWFCVIIAYLVCWIVESLIKLFYD
jgi:hypothetical protein